LGGLPQLLEEQRAGQVVVPDVVLDVQRSRGRADEQHACAERVHRRLEQLDARLRHRRSRCRCSPTAYASRIQARKTSSTSASDASRKVCRWLRGEKVSTLRKRGCSNRRASTTWPSIQARFGVSCANDIRTWKAMRDF